MAHYEQIQFCLRVKQNFPEHFKNKRVLDVGSLDINGNNRYLFKDCIYTGLDIAPGKNVDIICPAHLHNGKYDTIISTESFEHDIYYKDSLKNIVKMLEPNGLFLFTCASEGRPEHGTRRSEPSAAPLLSGEWADYYKNLTEEDIKEALNELYLIFRKYEFSREKPDDLYFYGIKY